MKDKSNNIANLLEQIRQLDNLLVLHKNDDDNFMLDQYTTKKNVFLKELVAELIQLNETSPKVFIIIQKIVAGLEKNTPVLAENEFSKKNKFSLAHLETIVLGKVAI